jgi:hypothetical protein
MMTSPEKILAYLKPRVSGATHRGEIATLMAPLASDSAWVHLGGSGARQQIFLLHGDLRAVFQFDTGDRLVAYGAYRSTELWEKNQTSTPVSPVSSSDVSLIFVSGKR